ncbi:MAG: hypothetical protein K2X27_06405 [Candidatus Obscuribacterales bacterium]|nr:hypothetical protein [Candidatus Obscuribacterales bacterium]
MSVLIGAFEFEGPYEDVLHLKEEPGLYAILCESKGEFELVELDETNSLRNCFDSDEYTSNMRFWQENSHGKLLAAVHYTPELTRQERFEMKNRLLLDFE